MSNFSAPFNTVVAHFENAGMNFHTDGDQKLVFFTMCGDAAVYTCRLRVTHEDDVLQIDLAIPVLARQPKVREQVVELVARANRGLPIGRFDIDMSDGQVTFHIGHAIASAGLDEDAVGRLFSTALATVDRYFPALMRLMYGGHTPEDAVYLSELETHSEKVADAKSSAPAKKPARRPRKKNSNPTKSADQPRLIDPSKGEGTDRPPKGL